MKTMKKLLLALLAVVLVSAAMLISVFAVELPWGDTAVADQYISAVNNAPFAQKKALLEKYDEYMETHRFPDSRLGQINLKLHLARANATKYEVTMASISALRDNPTYKKIDLEGEMTREKITKNIAYYNTVLAHYESLYYFDTTLDEYKAFAEELQPKVDAIKEMLDDRIAQYYTPPIEEYALAAGGKTTFELDGNGKLSTITVVQFNGKPGTYDGNGYTEIMTDFGSQGSTGSLHQVVHSTSGDPYTYASFGNKSPGSVFEYDLYYMGGSLTMHCGSAGLTGYHVSLGTISDEGVTSGYGDETCPGVTYENSAGLLVRDAWNKVAVAFNNTTKEFTIYLNYYRVGSYKWSLVNTNYGPQVCRFKLGGGEMYLDNITNYTGTVPRITNQMEGMNEVDTLKFYNKILQNEKGFYNFANRETSYNWIAENLATYYADGNYTSVIANDEEAKKIIDDFVAFDFTAYKVVHHVDAILNGGLPLTEQLEMYRDLEVTVSKTDYLDENKNINTEVVKEGTELYTAVNKFLYEIDTASLIDRYQMQNLDGLKEKYDALTAINDMDFNTITNRQNAITALEMYILATGSENISRKDPYTAIIEGVAAAKEKIEFDKVVRTISNYLDYYNKAINYATRARWQRRIIAEMYYKNVPVFETPEREQSLPSMVKKWEKLNAEMKEYDKGYNSEVAVKCINLVKEYALALLNEKNGTELTLADLTGEMVLEYVKAEYAAYEADPTVGKPAWDYIRKYILMARASMEDGYVESADGLAFALTFYEPLFNYYYKLVQIDHVSHLNETLARYETASTFIDKKGICTYVENYLVENDINHNLEDIIAIKERVAVIKAEITAAEGEDQSAAEKEYLVTLEENAGKFIAAVEQMKAATDYVTLNEAYLNAKQYYYFMAITDENVQAAVVTYMALEETLRTWKDNSDLFIGIVESLANARGLDDTYAKLVQAYAVKDLAEATYPGVAEALSAYNAAYTTYMDTVNAVNNEVTETVEVMTAQNSSYSVMDAVIRFFKKLFG